MVNLPPLTVAHALSAWRFQAAVVIPLIVVAAVYLWGVARVARRHPARPWPVFRTALFLAGLVTIAVALLSFIGVYDDTLFWIHMIQHLMLIMVAPALLVAGRPLILTMHATRNPVHTIVKRTLRSRPVTVLTCPMVTIPLYAGTVVGTHLTSFMNVVITNPAAETGEILLYLIVGIPVLPAQRRRRTHSLAAVRARQDGRRTPDHADRHVHRADAPDDRTRAVAGVRGAAPDVGPEPDHGRPLGRRDHVGGRRRHHDRVDSRLAVSLVVRHRA